MGAIFSPVNWIDEAGVVLSAPGMTILRALAEVQKPWGRGLARLHYASTADIQVRIDLGATRNIKTLGVIGCNGLTGNGIFFLGTTPGGYDVYEGGTLLDTNPSFSSDYGFPFSNSLWQHCPDPEGWNARYVTMNVVISNPSTFVDIRRIWVGGGFHVEEGIDGEYSLDFVDGSRSQRSDYGGLFVNNGTRWRLMRAGFSTRQFETMVKGVVGGYYDALWPRVASAGRGSEVVFARAVEADDPVLRYLYTVYGQMVEWAPLATRVGQIYGMESVTVEEAPLPALGV